MGAMIFRPHIADLSPAQQRAYWTCILDAAARADYEPAMMAHLYQAERIAPVPDFLPAMMATALDMRDDEPDPDDNATLLKEIKGELEDAGAAIEAAMHSLEQLKGKQA